MVAVVVSSHLTVHAATDFAIQWRIPQLVVAIVFIGLGISLPELSISIGAVLRKRGGLSVGNLIGSDIFDTWVPIGAAVVIHPLIFEVSLLHFELPNLMVLSAAPVYCLTRHTLLTRSSAPLMLILYVTYVGVKLLTQGSPALQRIQSLR